jgi:transposase
LTELARVGWFKAVQPKSEPAQLVATLIAARSRLIKMRADLVNQIRGLLKPFGLRPGKVHGATLAARAS